MDIIFEESFLERTKTWSIRIKQLLDRLRTRLFSASLTILDVPCVANAKLSSSALISMIDGGKLQMLVA